MYPTDGFNGLFPIVAWARFRSLIWWLFQIILISWLAGLKVLFVRLGRQQKKLSFLYLTLPLIYSMCSKKKKLLNQNQMRWRNILTGQSGILFLQLSANLVLLFLFILTSNSFIFLSIFFYLEMNIISLVIIDCSNQKWINPVFKNEFISETFKIERKLLLNVDTRKFFLCHWSSIENW